MGMRRRIIAFSADRFDQRELSLRLFAGSQKGHQRTVVPDRTIEVLASVAKPDGFCKDVTCGGFAGRNEIEVDNLLCHLGAPFVNAFHAIRGAPSKRSVSILGSSG